jgi:hypothetical protein
MGPLEHKLKALEYFKDWSNYMLVTTVAALGWVVSDDKGAVPPTGCLGTYTVIFLALSIIFAILTLALIPVVAEQVNGAGSFYDVNGKFRWFWGVPDNEQWVTLKVVCWPQHIFFILGVASYAAAALTAPSSAGHGCEVAYCSNGCIRFGVPAGLALLIIVAAIIGGVATRVRMREHKQVTTYYKRADIERLSDITQVPQVNYMREALENLLEKHNGTLAAEGGE